MRTKRFLFERVANEWWVLNVNLLSGMVAGELLTALLMLGHILKCTIFTHRSARLCNCDCSHRSRLLLRARPGIRCCNMRVVAAGAGCSGSLALRRSAAAAAEEQRRELMNDVASAYTKNLF